MTEQPSQAFKKLREKLHEIFQLDRADLDFGIYRIMNMKRDQIVSFLDDGLLPQVKAALSEYQSGDKDGLRNTLADLEKSIRDAGMNPDDSPKVKDLRAKLATSADATELEHEVYSHLFNFFRRYYHEGDFISQRRYKEGVYAIPYEGEEVKLHWANHDQYYIKTSEYLRDYTFRVDGGKRVHFKLVEATTEKDNVKSQKGKERRFSLVSEEPVVVENGEAVIRFTYLLNPEKQSDLNEQASEALKTNGVITKDFHELFATAPTEANPNRTVLEKHLAEYTARNTFDYFIHKNLGKFLRTELDFFIKNEVLHLDDVDTEGVGVEELQKRLAKIKALRKIALKLIDFLAQLEDFQKKLWLKKKFVVETSYLVTLDRIPEELYPEIAANEKQREEWVRLFAIDEIKGGEGEDMLTHATPGYSVPLTVEFLKANKGLVVDTRLFQALPQPALIEWIVEAAGETSGTLVHSDNYQSLRMLENRFGATVKCVYIDPPYNTGQDGFTYKDQYQHSSWASMIFDRATLLRKLLRSDGAFWASIDDREVRNLRYLLDDIFGSAQFVSDIAVVNNWKGRQDREHIATAHEHVLLYEMPEFDSFGLSLSEAQLADYDQIDDNGVQYQLRDLRKRGGADSREARPNLYFPVYWDLESQKASLTPTSEECIEIYPMKSDGSEGCWRWKQSTVEENLDILEARQVRETGRWNVNYRIYLEQDGETRTAKPKSVWAGTKYSSDRAIKILRAVLGATSFKSPKAVEFISDAILHSSCDDEWVMDVFLGSGTTVHSVLTANRQDQGERRYVCSEHSSDFDEVILPRTAKVVYCDTWKDGKPQNRTSGVSHFCKVIRLESYEDALANLSLTPPIGAADLLDPAPDSLGEDYLLRYMMEEETKGSASLLNVHRFADPTAYKLKVKAPGTDETREVAVDLLETFNWLIGLRVDHIAAPQTFSADFERDGNGRLTIKSDRLRQDDDGEHWFRTVTGWVPQNLRQPHDSPKLKVLIVWRKLTGDAEKDNLALDHYLRKQRFTAKDLEFDLIYVNGDNNLENLKRDDETWKVRLIEEDFHRLMFDGEDV